MTSQRSFASHAGATLLAVLCGSVLASPGVARGDGPITPPVEAQRAAPRRPGWLVDPSTGCWIWREFPQQGDTAFWTGECGPDGRATGHGVAEWRAADTTERYSGDFVDGRAHGRGSYVWANRNRYEGAFFEGWPHGIGVYTWANGNRYEGQFNRGTREGRGVLSWADGSRYEGDFVDGKRHGRGVTTWPGGDRYEGDYVDNRRHGRGVVTWADGNRYEGEFENDEQHGRGILTGKGVRYEGEFVAGKFHGRGTATAPDGGRYEGDFVGGQFHGRGVLTWADGDRYEGEFRNGKQHGRGVITSVDGRRYEGDFVDGLRHGPGTLTDATGQRDEGHFEQGVWVGGDWELSLKRATQAADEQRYADAEHLWTAAVRVAEQTGADPARLAVSLQGLAKVYKEQARYGDAEPLLRRSLALREQQVPVDEVDLAVALGMLGVNQASQRRLDEGERLLLRALPLAEKHLGPHAFMVADILDALAETRRHGGRVRDAEPLQVRALAIRERVFGPDHQHVATSLNNLALLYSAQQRYAEAEPLFARALVIVDNVVGDAHPWAATVRANLAQLLADQGRSSEAEPLLRRSLAVREHALAPSHPDVAAALMQLGELYYSEAQYADAAPLLQRAVALREEYLGPDDPAVAVALAALARVERADGRYQDTEALQRRVLAIAEKRRGPDAYEVSEALYALAETALTRANTSAADAFFGRADAIRKEHGESMVTAALQVLASRHIAQPNPSALVEAALAGVRREMSSAGSEGTFDVPGDDPVTRLKAVLERAAGLGQGRVERETLERAAVEAMIGSLEDPYTRLLSRDDARALTTLMTGRQIAMGFMTVRAGGRDYVWHVFPGTPADRAGLKPLDRIVSIADAQMRDASVGDPALRRGQTLTLNVFRAGEMQSRTVTVTRDVVSIPVVEHRFIRPGIGYVRVIYFAESTGKAMRAAIDDLRRQGLSGIILDLRHNAGGLSRELAPVADVVLPAAARLHEFETRHGRGHRVTRATPIVAASVPLAVLVDEDTASTAEMLAAAIQVHGRGVVVGEATAGAVAAKQMFWLPGGSALLVQTSRLLSAAGLALDGVGVIPDIVHPLAADDLDRGVDSQLERAVREVAAPRPQALNPIPPGAAAVVPPPWR